MHVLVTTDNSAGVATYTRELVSGLAARGVHVTLVSLGEVPSPEQTSWMEPLKNVDFRPTAFRLEWMRDASVDMEASAEVLQNIIDEVHPDLLHFSQFYYGALKTEIPKIVVAHSDVLSWWECVHQAAPKNDHWIRSYKEMVAKGLSEASVVVAPSQWMLNSLQRIYARPKLTSVIYNGRTPSLFQPHVSKEMSAVSAGRIWDLGKNSALLAQIDSPIPIFLAGPDAEPEHAANRKFFPPRKRLHVKVIDQDKQLHTLYARSSIYIATSQYEPFGMAAVEAALSRCAILASDIPTFRELWGDHACYFKTNDPESLARALHELSSDRDLCATYGKLAYYHALSRFSSSRMVEDYMHLYNAMMPAGVLAA